MKIFVEMIRENNKVEFIKMNYKKFKKMIDDEGFFNYEGYKYRIDPNAYFLREQKKLFIRKYNYFIIFREKNPEPIKYSVDKDLNEYQILLKSHVISEFLNSANTIDKTTLILMIMLGLAIGIIIGLVLEPHLFTTTIQQLK